MSRYNQQKPFEGLKDPVPLGHGHSPDTSQEGIGEKVLFWMRNLRERITQLFPGRLEQDVHVGEIETLKDPTLYDPSVGLNNLAAEMGADPGEIISLTEGVFADLVHDPDGLQRQVLEYLERHPQFTARIEEALSGLGTLPPEEAQEVDAALDAEIPAEIQPLIPEIQRAVTSGASPRVLMRLAEKLARVPAFVPATLAASVGAYFGLGQTEALAASPPPAPPAPSPLIDPERIAELIQNAGGGASSAGGAAPVTPTPSGGGSAGGDIFPDLPPLKEFIPDWGDFIHLPDKLGDLGTVVALLGSDFVLQKFVPRLTTMIKRRFPQLRRIPPRALPLAVSLAGWLGYGNSSVDAALPGNGNVLQYYFLLSVLQVIGRGGVSLLQKGAGTGIATRAGAAINTRFPRVSARAQTGARWAGIGLTWADRVLIWPLKAVLAGKGFMGD